MRSYAREGAVSTGRNVYLTAVHGAGNVELMPDGDVTRHAARGLSRVGDKLIGSALAGTEHDNADDVVIVEHFPRMERVTCP